MLPVPGVLATLVSKTVLSSLSASYGRSPAMDIVSSITVYPARLAIMFATIVQHRVQQGTTEPTTVELIVGAEAIRHSGRELSDPERAC